MADPTYTQTTEQLSLAAQYAAEDGKPVEGDEARSFAVEDNDLDGYIGVSPEYRTYANETEKPHLAEGDRADALAEEYAREQLVEDAANTVNETREDVNDTNGEPSNPTTGDTGKQPTPAS